jgi:ribosomal protein S18 acetylase RimI-like enzyme
MRSLHRLVPFRRKAALQSLAPEATSPEAMHTTTEVQPASGDSSNHPQQAVANNTSNTSNTLSSVAGVRALPRPAIKWIGPAGRMALREFDFASDADVICSWQEETYSTNFADFQYTDSFAAAFRHDLRRAALDPHHGLFVLDEGELVGFLWLVICENTWTRERYGYVNNLYIASARRKGGLARDLMGHADTWFRNHRIKRARLTVTVDNADACKLYERCGYDVARWEMEKNL